MPATLILNSTHEWRQPRLSALDAAKTSTAMKTDIPDGLDRNICPRPIDSAAAFVGTMPPRRLTNNVMTRSNQRHRIACRQENRRIAGRIAPLSPGEQARILVSPGRQSKALAQIAFARTSELEWQSPGPERPQRTSAQCRHLRTSHNARPTTTNGPNNTTTPPTHPPFTIGDFHRAFPEAFDLENVTAD